ncbi:APC family permease [Chryseobacterium sp. MYb264]|uniref:APC family permease n=1 Tax=Chryseobacterium sp. MYb264 TaxID=2745153 RepID=UPI002E100690|nr:APC family permease [Chryseobacterium sp. MYb264]
MELRIKPFPKNSYPKKGILIKGSSPLLWFQEMEGLGIDLNEVKSFAIPSDEPNILYGCFLIFNGSAPNEIGRNAYFQSVDDRLFIPENTIFYPQILPEEWKTAGSEYLIMHPDFGLVKLSEQIDWMEVIQNPVLDLSKVRKPSNGVKIPSEIQSYTVEMDDEKVLEALSKPKTDEEWMKDLPFDLKKVLAGNKKEIEKYLKYIEQYPERIVDLGVPLDVMGTSRGDGFEKFQFGGKMFGGGGFLGNLFGGNGKNIFGNLFGGNKNPDGAFAEENGSGKRSYFWIFWVILIVFSVVRLIIKVNDSSSNEVLGNSEHTNAGTVSPIPQDALIFQSGVTEIDMKIDSIYGKQRNELSKEMNKTRNVYANNNDAMIEDHLHRGGRKIEKVEDDVFFLKNRMKRSKDSLKQIYREKIINEIESKSKNIQKEISDSIKKSSNGNPVDKAVVKSVWNKKQILMIDSLGRFYGTLEEPDLPIIHDSKLRTNDAENIPEEKGSTFMEIIWLIIFMVGVVGILNLLVAKNKIDIGGSNVPVGVKVLLMTILAGMMIYIFYPLVEMFGYNWFVVLLICCVMALLYHLFRRDKTILKSNKNE